MKDFLSYSAEECAASEELMRIASEAIRSGEWTPSSPEPIFRGIFSCVMRAISEEMSEHPSASVSQLCSYLLFDFTRMADLRVNLARAYLTHFHLL